jgi:hypothetical protein
MSGASLPTAGVDRTGASASEATSSEPTNQYWL